MNKIILLEVDMYVNIGALLVILIVSDVTRTSAPN